MTVFVWSGFILLVLILIAFDLGVFTRDSKPLSAKTAMLRVGAYFVLAMLFTVFVYFAYQYDWLGLGVVPDPEKSDLPDAGWEAALQFFMGYILEQSLSIDNIFVIALILTHFKVSVSNQHRVLLWGILGALVMRGLMIAAGVELIESFSFMPYIFGTVLILTSVKMFMSGEDEEVDFEKNLMVRGIRRVFRFHPEFVGDQFFTRIDGKLAMTPLLLALIVVEASDLIFAIDSIPAVIGLTRDPFLVFTSNVFAILGLRSLYFALADLLGRFHLLKYSLMIILAFVGAKMLIEKQLPHDPQSKAIIHVVSFAVIIVTLLCGVAASFIFPPKAGEHPHEEPPESPAPSPTIQA